MGGRTGITRLSLVLCLVLIFAVSSFAQDSLNVTKIGELYSFWGDAFDLAIEGSYAYITTESAFRVIDISDPENMVELAGISGVFGGLDVQNSYVYLTQSAGICVFDVSDPASPMEIGNYEMPSGNPAFISVDGDYACTSGEQFIVLDISNPLIPVEVGRIDYLYLDAIDVEGVYAYSANSQSFYIIDISDPTNPLIEATCALGAYNDPSWDIEIAGSFAFIAKGIDHLRVVDFSNPLSPVMVGTGGDSFISTVAISGNLAHTGGGTLYVIMDISDPTGISTVNSFWVENDIQDIVLTDQVAFATHGGTLSAFDVSDPLDPQETGQIANPGYVHNLDLSGGYSYLAAGEAGLRIVDISNQTNPIEVGAFEDSVNFKDVAVAESYAYLVDDAYEPSDRGLWIIDVSDPSNPFDVGFCDLYWSCDEIAVNGDYAYVGVLNLGLKIISIDDPANPYLETDFYDGWVVDVAASGSFVYLVSTFDGFRIIDISNIEYPLSVGLYDYPCEAVAVAGSYAYIAGSDEFQVIDISDPELPVQAGSVPISGIAREITIDDGHAYVASDYQGIYIFDISDPFNPVETGYYNTIGSSNGAATVGSYAYLADGFSFSIFDCSDAIPVTPSPKTDPIPSTFSLSAYPNPFNPTTTLTFTLPHASNVTLDVFDINGRNVTNHQPLVTSHYEAGTHTTTFDGSNLSSGIYFVRLQAGEYINTQKVVLLK